MKVNIPGNDHIAGAFEIVNGVKEPQWVVVADNEYELVKWDYNRRYRFVFNTLQQTQQMVLIRIGAIFEHTEYGKIWMGYGPNMSTDANTLMGRVYFYDRAGQKSPVVGARVRARDLLSGAIFNYITGDGQKDIRTGLAIEKGLFTMKTKLEDFEFTIEKAGFYKETAVVKEVRRGLKPSLGNEAAPVEFEFIMKPTFWGWDKVNQNPMEMRVMNNVIKFKAPESTLYNLVLDCRISIMESNCWWLG